MSRFDLVYLDREERLRTGEQANANSRTSENAVTAKFAEPGFSEVRGSKLGQSGRGLGGWTGAGRGFGGPWPTGW